MSLVGTQVKQIKILASIGRGGMGEVYVGFDERLQRKVAIKAIRGERRLDDAARARFLREARILSQLDHPNICRIYDYIVHGDDELLVLELIDGVDLSRAIKDGLDRGRTIKIAIAIARVLDAAHAAGIVHRDLKPDNVILTADDQVKVLDFGLARSETHVPSVDEADGRTDAEPSDARSAEPIVAGEPDHPSFSTSPTMTAVGGTGSGGALQTVVGAVMGTPNFMSPEQARGESVTAASDIYSFGLLLQTMLSGRNPYPATIDLATLMRRVVEGDTLPVGDVPRELAALLARLTALAPAARITAADAVERLERIRDAPKRRTRIAGVAALALLSLVAAVKYTVDLRHERSIADQRRDQAESLIGFMLGDVREKLEPLGKLALLDDVGDKALDYFASVPEAELSDRELARRAQALYQIGDVRIRQGDLAAAMPAFTQAVALSDGLLRREPDNETWLGNAALSSFWLGNGYWNRGELPRALEQFERYRALSVDLAELAPDDADRALEVAYGEFNVGSVLKEMGELERAGEHLAACVRIVESLVAADPDRDDLQFELATNHLQVGRVREALGELDEAQRHHDEDLRIMLALTARDPQQPAWLEQLAIAHSDVSTLLGRRGDLSRAAEHARASVEVAEGLVARDPENLWWAGILAIGRGSLGRLVCRLGSHDDGTALLRSARRSFATLEARDPERPQWRLEHASTRIDLAAALLARGDDDGALAEATAARASVLPPNDAASGGERPRRLLAEAELLMGDALQAAARDDEARAAWSRALSTLEVIAVGTRDGTLRAPLAVALLRLGRGDEAAEVVAGLRDQGFVDPRLVSLE